MLLRLILESMIIFLNQSKIMESFYMEIQDIEKMDYLMEKNISARLRR